MAEYKSHQDREHREQLGSFYDCGLCGQHFTRKDARDRHERTVHAEGARGRPSMQGQPRISPDLQPGTSGKFHLFIYCNACSHFSSENNEYESQLFKKFNNNIGHINEIKLL